jgi:hypothetical protein
MQATIRYGTGALIVLLVLAILLSPWPSSLARADLIAPLTEGDRLDLPMFDSAIPSPDSVLGYPLGERFTPHSSILQYFEVLDAASDRVELWEYGKTYEGKSLTLLAISSPENIEHLQELQEQVQALAEPDRLSRTEREELTQSTPVVIWLSYGVHGNEASSSEAAMAVAYTLAAATEPWIETSDATAGLDQLHRLDDAIVLIDPVVNPDGRQRYVQFFEEHQGRMPNPLPDSIEHRERWPGGRFNHYLIDLNRDWTWASQIETQRRLVAYRSWEPHVFVDFHEMRAESTYFFPPSAEPIHPQISPRTAHWLEVFGSSNAAAFDRQGWLYYSAEKFDLFYPGYGDTYPALRGGVGMTYEAGGHGRAGQIIRRSDGSILRLSDRIARHFTTSLATISATLQHRGEILADFIADRQRAVEMSPTRYLWSRDSQEGQALADLLQLHGIRLEETIADSRIKAQLIGSELEEERRFSAGTLVVSTAQPLGRLVRTLMESDAEMSSDFIESQRFKVDANLDTSFFDITAWSVPLAFNVQAWQTSSGSLETHPRSRREVAGIEGEGRFGYLLQPQGLAGFRFVAGLQSAKIHYRLAFKEFKNSGLTYPAGSIFVPTRGNSRSHGEVEELDRDIAALARESGVTLTRTDTGRSATGVSLGSDAVVSVAAPRIGLIRGDGITPTAFGYLWHLFDQTLQIPHHQLDIHRLGTIDLAQFDVLVLPSGPGYARTISEETGETLERWVNDGGVLVGVGKAIEWLQDFNLTDVRSWEAPELETENEPNSLDQITADFRQLFIPGAAIATERNLTSPLTAGLSADPAAMFFGSKIFLPFKDPKQNSLVVRSKNPVLAGLAWPEARDRLKGALLIGWEKRGAGALILFAQEPFFRLFWRGTVGPFLHSTLHGPALNRSGLLRRGAIR